MTYRFLAVALLVTMLPTGVATPLYDHSSCGSLGDVRYCASARQYDNPAYLACPATPLTNASVGTSPATASAGTACSPVANSNMVQRNETWANASISPADLRVSTHAQADSSPWPDANACLMEATVAQERRTITARDTCPAVTTRQ